MVIGNNFPGIDGDVSIEYVEALRSQIDRRWYPLLSEKLPLNQPRVESHLIWFEGTVLNPVYYSPYLRIPKVFLPGISHASNLSLQKSRYIETLPKGSSHLATKTWLVFLDGGFTLQMF